MQLLNHSHFSAPETCALPAPAVTSVASLFTPGRIARQSAKRVACAILGIAAASALTLAAPAQSPVAFVYVAQSGQTYIGGPEPVYAFSADAKGKLTPIEGSPFTQLAGQMVGTTGSHFVTRAYGGSNPPAFVPLSYLHAYQVNANGAIGQQTSEIDSQSYTGSTCAGEPQANWPDVPEIDHTGSDIYLPYCSSAVQTYRLSKSGLLTFQNVSMIPTDEATDGTPKLAGNDSFGYTQVVTTGPHLPYGTFLAFRRTSDGSLQYQGIPTIKWPSAPDGYEFSVPDIATGSYGGLYTSSGLLPQVPMTDDPANHFAVILDVSRFTPPDTTAGEGCAIASFTMDSKGNLASTNTLDQMPRDCGSRILSSPDGKTLVVLNSADLYFYHFNGAGPITRYAQVSAPSGWFTNVAWDNSGHLYAQNGLDGKLHVYTVTSSRVGEASGSPYSLPFCGYQNMPGDYGPLCDQSIVVRILPAASQSTK